MRYCGIILFVWLASCAPPPTTSTASYQEDLSKLRPTIDSIPKDTSRMQVSSETVPLQGHIKVELDSIIRYSVEQNKINNQVDGFFIQIYAGNSRDRANALRNKAADFFPELEPKISYRQPNFRVLAGRFTDRLEATRVFRDVKEEFPKALLVPDRFKVNYE